MPGDRKHRFLHHILRLDLGQAGLDGDGEDQLPISIKEDLPTRLILPVLQSLDQSRTRWNQLVLGLYHASA